MSRHVHACDTMQSIHAIMHTKHLLLCCPVNSVTITMHTDTVLPGHHTVSPVTGSPTPCSASWDIQLAWKYNTQSKYLYMYIILFTLIQLCTLYRCIHLCAGTHPCILNCTNYIHVHNVHIV